MLGIHWAKLIYLPKCSQSLSIKGILDTTLSTKLNASVSAISNIAIYIKTMRGLPKKRLSTIVLLTLSVVSSGLKFMDIYFFKCSILQLYFLIFIFLLYFTILDFFMFTKIFLISFIYTFA